MAEQLMVASIGNLIFYTTAEGVRTQKKVKQQKYVGTNDDYTEQLGNYSDSYTIEGYFKQNENEDGASQLNQLQQLQQSQQLVTVSLPMSKRVIQGIIETLNSSIDVTEYGTVPFTLDFIVQGTNQTLQQASYTSASIINQTNEVLAASEAMLSNNYKLTSNHAAATSFAVNDFTKFTDGIKSAFSDVDSVVNSCNQFIKQINQVIYKADAIANAYVTGGVWGAIASLISVTPGLYNALNPICQLAQNLDATYYAISTVENVVSVTDVTNYDTPEQNDYTIPVVPISNTPLTEPINSNRVAISIATQSAAFACLCQQACTQTFVTTQQIENVMTNISDVYSGVITNFTTIDSFGNFSTDIDDSTDLFTKLTELAYNTLDILAAAKQNSASINVVDLTVPTTGIALAYGNYATRMLNNNTYTADTFEEYLEVISSLNSDQSQINLNGGVNVFTVNN